MSTKIARRYDPRVAGIIDGTTPAGTASALGAGAIAAGAIAFDAAAIPAAPATRAQIGCVDDDGYCIPGSPYGAWRVYDSSDVTKYIRLRHSSSDGTAYLSDQAGPCKVTLLGVVISVGGNNVIQLGGADASSFGLLLGSVRGIAWGESDAYNATKDTSLYRAAAGVIAAGTGAASGVGSFQGSGLATPAGTDLALSATAPAAAAGASVAGKTATPTASAAVASTDTDGAAAGGSVTITAGAAARRNSGNADGGNVVATVGEPIGTGAPGYLHVKRATGTFIKVMPDRDGGGSNYIWSDSYLSVVSGGTSPHSDDGGTYVKVGAGVVEFGPGSSNLRNKGYYQAAQISEPTPESNTACFYAGDVAGTAEAFAVDEAGNQVQLTAHASDAPPDMYDPADPWPEIGFSYQRYLGLIRWKSATETRLETLADYQARGGTRGLRVHTWDEDQAERARRVNEEIARWQESHDRVPASVAERFRRETEEATRKAADATNAERKAAASAAHAEAVKAAQAKHDKTAAGVKAENARRLADAREAEAIRGELVEPEPALEMPAFVAPDAAPPVLVTDAETTADIERILAERADEIAAQVEADRARMPARPADFVRKAMPKWLADRVKR